MSSNFLWVWNIGQRFLFQETSRDAIPCILYKCSKAKRHHTRFQSFWGTKEKCTSSFDSYVNHNFWSLTTQNWCSKGLPMLLHKQIFYWKSFTMLITILSQKCEVGTFLPYFFELCVFFTIFFPSRILTLWYGGESFELPSLDSLSLETRTACDQFRSQHLESCKKDIAKDLR